MAHKGGIGGNLGRREVVKRLGELSSCEIYHDKVVEDEANFVTCLRSEEAGREELPGAFLRPGPVSRPLLPSSE